MHESLENIIVIRHRLNTSYSRHMTYADNRKWPLEFYVSDEVYLKISPMEDVMRFGRKSKLSPRYVGPYKILNVRVRWHMS